VHVDMLLMFNYCYLPRSGEYYHYCTHYFLFVNCTLSVVHFKVTIIFNVK